jgi:predicted RNA-binding protein with RPS1 domain
MSRGIPGAPEEPINVGDTIDVYVMEAEDQEGNPVLSKKRADFEKAWERVLVSKNEQETLHAMVTDRVKGGLVVDLGIRGFIPASHVGSGRVRNLEQYIGQVLPLKVIEVDKERRKVVLSHRLATEEEREKQREDTVASLQEGQVRPGTVRRITDYGAFVDLGGIDGLLHISEMSWIRIKHPSEVVKVGDQIQVMVLKVNLEQNRVSLGLRQILPDPWTEVAARFNIGDVVTGQVSRLVPFGAFVQLDGGIEGIIPNTELSSKRVNKPEQVVKVGDEVEVKVTDIDKDGRRIVLSRRQLESLKEQENFQQFTRERQERQERQTQQTGREPQRFTIGDALADQLGALGRGEDAGTPEPSAEPIDLTESVETLAASPAEDASDFTATDPVPAPNSEGASAGGPVPAEDLSDFTAPEKVPADEAPSANEAASPHEGESASTIVSEAAADAALAEAESPVFEQSVSPQGMGGGGAEGDTSEGRSEVVAATEPTGEASADAPTTAGAGGSALLEDEQAHTEASERDARNA